MRQSPRNCSKISSKNIEHSSKIDPGASPNAFRMAPGGLREAKVALSWLCGTGQLVGHEISAPGTNMNTIRIEIGSLDWGIVSLDWGLDVCVGERILRLDGMSRLASDVWTDVGCLD